MIIHRTWNGHIILWLVYICICFVVVVFCLRISYMLTHAATLIIYTKSHYIYIFGIKMQSELVRVSICSEDNRLCQLIRYADYPAHRSHHQRCLKVRGIRISLRDALNMCGWEMRWLIIYVNQVWYLWKWDEAPPTCPQPPHAMPYGGGNDGVPLYKWVQTVNAI